MRRLLWWLFAFAALLATLIPANDALAQKPVAECREGKCVMDEADYRKLQEFYQALKAFAEATEKKAEIDGQISSNLMRELYSCKAQLNQRNASEVTPHAR